MITLRLANDGGGRLDLLPKAVSALIYDDDGEGTEVVLSSGEHYHVREFHKDIREMIGWE